MNCGTCERVCPMSVGSCYPAGEISSHVVGAINKNEDVRRESTSGGVFSALSKAVLSQGGDVYGVCQDEDNQVRHILVRSDEELAKIRGSKYVQSNLSDSFPQISKRLEEGVKVLFSGTPCQIMALYSFLGERPKGLVTVEVVCHGVTSPLFYKKYLKETGAATFSFREKERSWQDYDVRFQKRNGHWVRQKACRNLYMKGYLQNLLLRPSCYQCPAKPHKSGADLTIGDFWGVQKILPFFFDDKGVSLVLIHTASGAALWKAVSSMMDCCVVKGEQYLDYNPSIWKSSAYPSDKEEFLAIVKEKGLCRALRIYTRASLKDRAKSNILKIWNNLWAAGLEVRRLLFGIADTFCKLRYPTPDVKSIQETLTHILTSRCSVSRFGDGEMKLIQGISTSFQDADMALSRKLKDVLHGKYENLIICVPPIFKDMELLRPEERSYWAFHILRNRKSWYRYMDLSATYFNAFISRCYMPYLDKSQAVSFFRLWKEVWRGRDVILVEGEKTRFGACNDLLSSARSVKRILCPNTQAFRLYSSFLKEVLKLDKDHLVLLALGPVATIMAAELSTMGYQAIDVGHLDIEYEWFLTGAKHKIPVEYKFVNEAGGATSQIEDLLTDSYTKQVVCHL